MEGTASGSLAFIAPADVGNGSAGGPDALLLGGATPGAGFFALARGRLILGHGRGDGGEEIRGNGRFGHGLSYREPRLIDPAGDVALGPCLATQPLLGASLEDLEDPRLGGSHGREMLAALLDGDQAGAAAGVAATAMVQPEFAARGGCQDRGFPLQGDLADQLAFE